MLEHSRASTSSQSVVEVLYNYESTSARGHCVNVRPGERYSLVSSANENWWFVAKEADIEDGFYLPRSYVKSLDPSDDPNESFPNFRPRLFDGRELSDSAGNGRRQDKIFSSDGYRLLTTPESADNDGSLKRASKGFGFKLADPKRISKSIPVDLNFVHNIPHLAAQQAVAERLQNEELTDASSLEIVTAVPRPQLSVPPQAQDSSHLLNESVEEVELNSCAEDLTSLTNGFQSTEKSENFVECFYENLEVNRSKGKPPVPLPHECPIRIVQEEWEEFVDKNGRSYFYHRATGLSTWKPPRSLVAPKLGSLHAGNELDSSFSADDFERSQEEMHSSFSHHSRNELLLEGAVESFDSQNETVSAPPPTSSSPDHLCTKEEFECSCSQPSSSLTTSSESAGSGRGLGRSVNFVTNRGYGIKPGRRDSGDAFTYSEDLACFARNPSLHLPGSPREVHLEIEEGKQISRQPSITFGSFHRHTALKSGLINKCRYAEAGKRIKKQWLSLFAYLTGAHIIFYRDEKSSQKKGNHYTAPLGVCDLRGARISWLEGALTRRKHVFQLELIDGTVDLFNTDEEREINSWFHAIRQSILRLPQPEFYPSPFVDSQHESSTSRPHQKNWNGGSSPKPPPCEPRPDTASPSSGKLAKKEKRRSGPAAQVHVSDAEQNRATILEKLRRFFRNRPSIDSLKEKGIYKPEPVFGSSLIEICKREKLTVPKFLTVCTEVIEDKGLAVDGLYRISGNLSQVQKIRCQVDQDSYNLLINEGDVHVLTGALKLFFRELQDPLFPFHMTKDFIAAIKLQSPKQRRSVFRDLLKRMPATHYDSLKVLLEHLLRVSENATENRMQIHNLAIVFGPTLFGTGQGAQGTSSTQSGSGKNVGKKRGGGMVTTSHGSGGQEGGVVQSNSHLAFNMIMQGQIVEYLLKEFNRLFR